MTTLEERKVKLQGQIDRLKREIDRLKWLESREISLCSCTSSVEYIILKSLREKSVN
jgi:hypothetical protein